MAADFRGPTNVWIKVDSLATASSDDPLDAVPLVFKADLKKAKLHKVVGDQRVPQAKSRFWTQLRQELSDWQASAHAVSRPNEFGKVLGSYGVFMKLADMALDDPRETEPDGIVSATSDAVLTFRLAVSASLFELKWNFSGFEFCNYMWVAAQVRRTQS